MGNIQESEMGIGQEFEGGESVLLSAVEVREFAAWLLSVSTPLPREDKNSDVCQILSRILRANNATREEHRQSCICRG
ncbi:hypothetical protein [Streptomyces sp. NPDC091278]|uniref:hypothetical protein n=1 Tax=Streptomyces sp. NPDC091278 TaxID=3155301 RepID=UPI00344F9359